MAASDHLGPQFQSFVDRVSQTGGATMNMRSGRLVAPGQKAYMVGGLPDKTGTRIPTTKIPVSEFSAQHVQEHVERLQTSKKGKGGNLGAWVDEGNVELDASGITTRKNKALRNGARRGEKEIWDNANMRGIDTGGRNK